MWREVLKVLRRAPSLACPNGLLEVREAGYHSPPLVRHVYRGGVRWEMGRSVNAKLLIVD